MKRQIFSKALTFGVIASAIVLTGCETTESRISDHPEIYQRLSPADQALISRGQIRLGMSQDAAWLSWGSPEQKVAGAMRGRTTETWVYVELRTAPYGSAYYPYYGYGPRFGFGGGFGVIRAHHGRRFVFVGDPFYDPFYYSYLPPTVPVPYKTVTFSNGRVISFQHLVPPYRY